VNEKQAEYLAEIYRANQRMIATINSLLNISRIEMGTFAISTKEIKIKDIVDETVEELASRFNRKIDLKKSYDPTLDLFVADPNILQIIIDNLLSNAFKYSPPEDTKIQVTAKMNNGSLVLSVTDNGIGILPKDQNRVFEKLFRGDNAVSANPDGTGLGLYMIKKIIVDGLGGKIWFESEENKGTTFYVSFPASGMKEKPGSTTLARIATH
jgi:two-component system sensor histidine kinase VicK